MNGNLIMIGISFKRLHLRTRPPVACNYRALSEQRNNHLPGFPSLFCHPPRSHPQMISNQPVCGVKESLHVPDREIIAFNCLFLLFFPIEREYNEVIKGWSEQTNVGSRITLFLGGWSVDESCMISFVKVSIYIIIVIQI